MCVAVDACRVVYWSRREAGDQEARWCDLWVLDVRTGESRHAFEAEEISLGVGRTMSPTGDEMAFCAGPKGREAVHILRFADLSVRKLELADGPSPVYGVRWRRDGSLRITERASRREADQHEPVRVTVWTLAPGSARALRLYQAEAPWVGLSLSPAGGWLLVWAGRDDEHTDRIELIDTASGAARALPLAGPPEPGRVAWARDDTAFAYTEMKPGGETLVLVDPATGAATRPYTCTDGDMRWLCLPSRARFAAFVVDHGRASRIRIVHPPSGRQATLRQVSPFGVWLLPWSFSPSGSTLAVVRRRGFPLRDPVSIRLIDLRPLE
jgi:hypothetical protein